MDLWEVMIILEEWTPDPDAGKVAAPTSEDHRRNVERWG